MINARLAVIEKHINEQPNITVTYFLPDNKINLPRRSRGYYYNGPKGLKLPAALKSACTVRPLHTISCYP